MIRQRLFSLFQDGRVFKSDLPCFCIHADFIIDVLEVIFFLIVFVLFFGSDFQIFDPCLFINGFISFYKILFGSFFLFILGEALVHLIVMTAVPVFYEIFHSVFGRFRFRAADQTYDSCE